MYHVSAQGVDEPIINVHYYHYYMLLSSGCLPTTLICIVVWLRSCLLLRSETLGTSINHNARNIEPSDKETNNGTVLKTTFALQMDGVECKRAFPSA